MARKKVFISYSYIDRAFAESIPALLESGANKPEVFCAGHSLEAGDQFKSKILRNLREADIVVVVSSHNAAKSEWVLAEIGAALAFDKVILPILCGCTIEETPKMLREIHHEESVGSLIRKICSRFGDCPEPHAIGNAVVAGSRVMLPQDTPPSAYRGDGNRPVEWTPEMDPYFGAQSPVAEVSEELRAAKLECDQGQFWYAIEWLTILN
tara:strand:+ start:10159 stop:10788 length:630 start_codon:yes stop_codon:yes gene_type:complete